MKYATLLSGLIFLSLFLSAQTHTYPGSLEFGISVNHTIPKHGFYDNKMGFGAGAYSLCFPDKRLNLMFGLEYNRTYQFIDQMYEGHFAHSTDLYYTMNCISIPIGIRVNAGKRVKVFMETGGYADLMLSSGRKGTMHTYYPNANNLITYNEYPFDQKARLSNAVGIFVSMGISIPVWQTELIIKPAYKFALTDVYSDMESIYNRYGQLTIGIKFR